ncbi:MAG: Fe-S cluster assembly protein SufD [Bacteroidia bacterium]|nr:Fe-S cluster assembly protein SufD [Bacteroidia bacterium]MCF8425557.1 Fe-S cluster assembly protein SufD [Bacteroidia bacterium]MCF8447471.1 Fe-S cluster assembly protein SufD [Bacteroidia bacterium]
MSLLEQIKNDFSDYAKQAEQDSFFDTRAQAFAEFEKIGLPTQKHEEWKYTNLRKLSEGGFATTCVSKIDAKTFLEVGILNKIESHKIVFVNGCLYPELNVILEEEEGVIISNLAQARKNHSALFSAHFGKYAKFEGEGLNAMNTALMSDGAFVFVPKGKQLKHPILITNIVDATETNVLQQPRNLVIIEESASATIIENYISMGINSSFTNVVNEIFVDENAQLEHYKVQRTGGESYHNNYTQIFQNGNTNINQVTLTLNGQWVRNNLHFYMNGENCNSLLYGLYIPDGNQFVDNHSRVDHAKPNCFSDEKYKGILKDQSTAVFNGKIMVHIDAQKTNAYQRNQNILLSNDATVNTKPQLEIFADDVKCTHGATIGQLDEEPMFYLRSRGISENEARKLLLNAFADDIAEKIKIPELVQILEAEIERKL